MRIRLRDSPVKKTERIPQEKELLRRVQELEYRTEKIKCLVYVV
jgi:hypothetical protein